MNPNYSIFSEVYAQIFDETLYQDWQRFFHKKVDQHLKTEDLKILDLACGDGRFALLLAEEGLWVQGIDISREMIEKAEEFSVERGLYVPFSIGDMRQFTLEEKMSVITIFSDSLCYLPTKEDVLKTFESCYQALEPGGLLLFDYHSPYQMNTLFPEFHWVEEWDDALFAWRSEQTRGKNTIDHHLHFFIQEEDTDAYQHLEEFHEEQIFEDSLYRSLLEQAGFEYLSLEADFEEKAPIETSKRYFVTARRK